MTINVETKTAIADFNARYAAAHGAGLKSDREKLEVVIGGRRLITDLGGPAAIVELAASAGIEGEFKYPYAKGAQLITGYVIAATNDKRLKKQYRNLVNRAAQLMGALDNAVAKGVRIGETDQQIVNWVEDQDDGWNGVIRKYLGSGKAEGQEDDEENVIDLDDYRVALERTAYKLPIPQADNPANSMNAVLPSISVHQRSGDDLMVLPLNLPAHLMEQLRPYLPAEDASIPDAIRFWGRVTTLCQLFDRHDSNVPLHANQPDHEGQQMAPSLPIIRVLPGGDLSIAASRAVAGMVVVVSAFEAANVGQAEHKNKHINGVGTNALLAHLSSASGRAAYDGIDYVSEANGKDWLKFKSRLSDVKDFRVRLLGLGEFGSSRPQWTLEVREEYDAKASSTVDMPDGIVPADLLKFAGKVSGSKHPVVVTIKDGKLSLALGKSSQWTVESAGGGSAKAEIASGDFARVLALVSDLRVAGCAVFIDPAGLVVIRFATSTGDITVHIPTLLKEGGRSPALLKRIEKPATVPVEEPAGQLAA